MKFQPREIVVLLQVSQRPVVFEHELQVRAADHALAGQDQKWRTAPGSTSRCKRYQLVCGIRRSSSGALRIKSRITRGKLPSRKRKSAALTASQRLRCIVPKADAADVRCRAAADQRNPAHRSRARKYRSCAADWRRRQMSNAVPALRLGLVTSVIAPFCKPPSVASSSAGIPVTTRACVDIRRLWETLRRAVGADRQSCCSLPCLEDDMAANYVELNTKLACVARSDRPRVDGLFPDQRNHHALGSAIPGRHQIREERILPPLGKGDHAPSRIVSASSHRQSALPQYLRYGLLSGPP